MDRVKNEKDFRPESFRPRSHDTEIKLVGEVAADGDAGKAMSVSNRKTGLAGERDR